MEMGRVMAAGSLLGASTSVLAILVACCHAFVLALAQQGSSSSQLVPAIITFGDSSVDVGNNDYLKTLFRADYPPYGRDFPSKQATGRFCNGKLATDITAETLGFSKFPPAYLSPDAAGKNLLIGANFASAGSGYDDLTAELSHAIPLSQQVEYFKKYQSDLANVAGAKKAASTLQDALYLVSSGSSDFLQNYYVNPFVYKKYTPAQYSSYLVQIFANLVKDLYGMGARRIGVTSLPPLGCVPAAITLFGYGSNACVKRLNDNARVFNMKINASIASLGKQLPNLTLALFDVYQPLLRLVDKPSDAGFAEARKACCGTGTVETTVLLCNPKSTGTCANATEYVFWDAVHPSEAANQVIAGSLILAGISLIT